MRINLVTLGNEPILAGAINGKKAFVFLVTTIENVPSEPTPLFLDFVDVEVATASYLRESIFSLKGYLRAEGSKYYPVVVNPNEAVQDELSLVAQAKGDAFLSCTLSNEDLISNVSVIGTLDPKQKMTFDLVNDLKSTDANGLMEKYGTKEQVKSTTAWNNRLASLVSKGLIREFSNGRAKYYRPVLEV